MNRLVLAVTLLQGVLLEGCVEDVSKGKTEAVLSEPAKTTATAPPVPTATATPAPVAPQGTAWPVDPASSEIRALGAKVTKTETVRFPQFTGELAVADGKVTGLHFTVDLKALDTGNPKLSGHLNSPDFFDTASFPTATFQSTEIKEGATDAGMTHTVTGDLTMHGITKGVTFPMTLKVEGDTATGKTEFAINRQDWKIAYQGKPDDLVQDKVVLTVNVKAASPGTATAER
jgi:polyisoprenoid-binding protein YceI